MRRVLRALAPKRASSTVVSLPGGVNISVPASTSSSGGGDTRKPRRSPRRNSKAPDVSTTAVSRESTPQHRSPTENQFRRHTEALSATLTRDDWLVVQAEEELSKETTRAMQHAKAVSFLSSEVHPLLQKLDDFRISRPVDAFPPPLVIRTWYGLVSLLKGVKRHGEREGAVAGRLRRTVALLDTWTFRSADCFSGDEVAKMFRIASRISRLGDGLYVSDKTLDALGKRGVALAREVSTSTLVDSMKTEHDGDDQLRGEDNSNPSSSLAVHSEAYPPAPASVVAAAFSPEAAAALIVTLGAMRWKGHFNFHQLVHIGALSAIRGREAEVLTTTESWRHAIGCYAHYQVTGVSAANLAALVIEGAHRLNIRDCGVLLHVVRTWNEPPANLVDAIAHRAAEIISEGGDALRYDKDLRKSAFAVLKGIVGIKEHSDWASLYVPVVESLAPMLLDLRATHDREVASVLRSILHRNTVIPYTPVHLGLCRRLLASGVVSSDYAHGSFYAGLVFEAYAHVPSSADIAPAERQKLQELLLAHTQDFTSGGSVTRLSKSGFAAAMSVVKLSDLPRKQLMALGQHFASIAVSLRPDEFAAAMNGLSEVHRDAMDDVTAERMLTHVSDPAVLARLTPNGWVDLLEATATLTGTRVTQPEDHLGPSNPRAHPQAVGRLVSTVTRNLERVDIGQLPALVRALDANNAFYANVFSRCTRVLLSQIADAASSTMLDAFAALASEFSAGSRRGSAFEDCWDAVRSRVVEEAHRYGPDETRAALDAFAALDVHDAGLFSVLVQRLRTLEEELPQSVIPGEIIGRLTGPAVCVLLRYGASPAMLDAGSPPPSWLMAALFRVNGTLTDLYPVDVVAVLPLLMQMLRTFHQITSASNGDEHPDALPVGVLPVLHRVVENTRDVYLAMYGPEASANMAQNVWSQRVLASLKLSPAAFSGIVTNLAASEIVDSAIITASVSRLSHAQDLLQLPTPDMLNYLGALLHLRGDSSSKSTAPDWDDALAIGAVLESLAARGRFLSLEDANAALRMLLAAVAPHKEQLRIAAARQQRIHEQQQQLLAESDGHHGVSVSQPPAVEEELAPSVHSLLRGAMKLEVALDARLASDESNQETNSSGGAPVEHEAAPTQAVAQPEPEVESTPPVVDQDPEDIFF